MTTEWTSEVATPARLSRSGATPFFFGAPEAPLYGCLHRPREERNRSCGVVLCYPAGHEYFPAYRAYQEIAVRCAEQGLHALRFDYFGSGDSAGESEDFRLGIGIENVATAVEELRRRTGVSRVCLLGLRLGATMACLAGAGGAAGGSLGADGIVLWDPVVLGSDYLRETVAVHRMMLRFCHLKAEPRGAEARPAELLGFPVPGELYGEICALDLNQIAGVPARNVLMMQTGNDGGAEIVERLTQLGATVETRRADPPKLWTQAPNEALLAACVREDIVSWVDEVLT